MKYIASILCTLVLTACGGGGGGVASIPVPPSSPPPVAPPSNTMLSAENNSVTVTDIVDYPTVGNYDFSSVNYGFGRFGSTTATCFVAQTFARLNGVSSSAIPDAPLYVGCVQGDGSVKEVSQQLFGAQLYVNGNYPLVADFNGDGIDDLFLYDAYDGNSPAGFEVALISNTNGTYTQNRYTMTDPGGWAIGSDQNAATDINHDGCLDVLNVGGKSMLQVKSGTTCTGAFTEQYYTGSIAQYGSAVCAGDFANLGYDQYVFADANNANLAVPNNILTIDPTTFAITSVTALPMPYWNVLNNATTANPAAHNFACRTADINNDGHPDILIFTRPMPAFATGGGWSSQSYVQVYLNNGTGGFTDISATALPGYNTNTMGSYSPRIIDINGDGYLDIVLEGTTFSNAPGNQVWINNKNNTFTSVFTNELTNLYASVPSTASGMIPSMLPIQVNNAWNYIIQVQDSNNHYHIEVANTQYVFK